MFVVPEAKEQHCAGGWGAGEGPSAEAEQGQPPTEHRETTRRASTRSTVISIWFQDAHANGR